MHSLHMRKPFFSVLVTSYNRPVFLKAAIESILNSTLNDYELIISDDCSPKLDEIENVVSQFMPDSRIRFFKNEKNIGEAKNRENLIGLAKSEWLIILCDDDLLEKEALRKIKKEIDSYPDYSLFTFGYTLINQNGLIKYTRKSPKRITIDIEKIDLLKEFLMFDIFPYWFFSPVTFCFNKKIAKKIAPNKNVGIGDDLVYLIDVLLLGEKIMILPEVFMAYRKFEINDSMEQINQSFLPIHNLISRSLILNYLKNNELLFGELKHYINSEKYKLHFLFIPVVQSKININVIREELSITKEEAERIVSLGRNILYKFKLSSKIIRISNYLKVTGFAGVIEIFRFLSSVCIYRLIPKKKLHK